MTLKMCPEHDYLLLRSELVFPPERAETVRDLGIVRDTFYCRRCLEYRVVENKRSPQDWVKEG